jgi:CheY-like chemotaxis protein
VPPKQRPSPSWSTAVSCLDVDARSHEDGREGSGKGPNASMTERTILVVDDEPSIRDLIVAVLEEEGYAARSAETGFQAIELVAAVRPDLVLLDMMMPQMDGQETMRRMRQMPEGKELPVVVMSAAVTADRLTDGVAAFIAKPFDLVALLETIEGVLDGSLPANTIVRS